MDKKVYCDELDYLSDLPIFKDKVNFKIHDKEYVVKESYQEVGLEKKDDEIYLKINEVKCYDNKETKYIIKLDPTNNNIISYKGDGPALFTYVKPITRSTRTIINRESKSLGYKLSSGELMNATKVNRHMVFSKTNDELIRMSKEFFKGNEDDEDHPPLNTITNVEFIDNPDDIEGFKYGIETIFMFDKAGNIEEHTVANTIYGQTISGELITLDTDYKYTSSDDYKRNIIPQLEVKDNNEYAIRYIQKENSFITLATETFKMNEDHLLIPLSVESKFVTAQFFLLNDGSFDCTTKVYGKDNNIDDFIYTIESNTKFPLSADYFAFSNYKGDISLAKNSFFNNIYETDNGIECFMNENRLISATIEENNKEIKYNFTLDEYEIINSCSITIDNKISNDVCIYKESILPNKNKIIESCIPAEFKFPVDKKSLFYRAVEIGNDNGKDYVVSDYRALIVPEPH